MIIFKLTCASGHDFEGWFGDSQDYDQQKAKGLLSCPMCSSNDVHKVLAAAPFLKSKDAKASDNVVGRQNRPVALGPQPKAAAAPAKQLQKNIDPIMLIKALNQHIKNNFEDVGKRFFDEAMKVHRGESDARNLYGEVTPEQREKLDEEEVNYMVVPKLAPKFEN